MDRSEGEKAVVLNYQPVSEERLADVKHAKQIAAG